MMRIEAFRRVFFDRQAVISAVDRATRQTLSKGGALVRKIAMNSIRPAPSGKYSPPGSPPYDHVGFVNKQFNRQRKRLGIAPVRLTGNQRGLRAILFGFDPGRRSVIIGATLISKPYSGGITVPQLLEFGGTVTKRNKQRITVAPHPFMRPAMEKSGGPFLELWKNSVKR